MKLINRIRWILRAKFDIEKDNCIILYGKSKLFRLLYTINPLNWLRHYPKFITHIWDCLLNTGIISERVWNQHRPKWKITHKEWRKRLTDKLEWQYKSLKRAGYFKKWD